MVVFESMKDIRTAKAETIDPAPMNGRHIVLARGAAFWGAL